MNFFQKLFFFDTFISDFLKKKKKKKKEKSQT